ncbi:hypothetical protein [Niveispirillum fermenti]|uniref:hypothetical protein n=1 Tax=Niveispirillum fermenti TaxID=1233113 RepID=UPI003A843577
MFSVEMARDGDRHGQVMATDVQPPGRRRVPLRRGNDDDYVVDPWGQHCAARFRTSHAMPGVEHIFSFIFNMLYHVSRGNEKPLRAR